MSNDLSQSGTSESSSSFIESGMTSGAVFGRSIGVGGGGGASSVFSQSGSGSASGVLAGAGGGGAGGGPPPSRDFRKSVLNFGGSSTPIIKPPVCLGGGAV